MKRLLVLLALLAIAACGRGPQNLVSSCLEDPALCPACTTSADCAIASNACQENAYCAHRDANVAVTQEGCSGALEYDPPEDVACACVNQVCQAERTYCAIPEGCPED